MQIEQDIRQFVIDSFLFGESNGNLSNDDSFLEKGLIDSMGILTLITFVEQQYAVSVLEDELVMDNWDSVRRIARFVQGKLQVRQEV